jgi:hypothetical protein
MACERPSCVTLQWTQVDFEAATLVVTRAKNGTPATHPLTGRELRALRRLHREAEGRSPFLFVSERGAPMTVSNFQKLISQASEAAGLEIKAHPHMLRHACGFTLANDTETAGMGAGPAYGAVQGATQGAIPREQRAQRAIGDRNQINLQKRKRNKQADQQTVKRAMAMRNRICAYGRPRTAGRTVEENLFLGREITAGGFLNRAAMRLTDGCSDDRSRR